MPLPKMPEVKSSKMVKQVKTPCSKQCFILYDLRGSVCQLAYLFPY